jgi:TRAP-type mannitol/chloroaromatic compound transport system permease small subunit
MIVIYYRRQESGDRSQNPGDRIRILIKRFIITSVSWILTSGIFNLLNMKEVYG